MELQKKKIEGIQFTGDNFEELKAFWPALEKLSFRSKEEVKVSAAAYLKKPGAEFKGYTVGAYRDLGPPFGKALTEALPGFWIIKEGDDYRIITPEEFKKEFD